MYRQTGSKVFLKLIFKVGLNNKEQLNIFFFAVCRGGDTRVEMLVN